MGKKGGRGVSRVGQLYFLMPVPDRMRQGRARKRLERGSRGIVWMA